jgi:hypothetical protein
VHGHGQFFSGELKLYGAKALAEIALTRKDCDAAVGADCDPAIDLSVINIA